MKSFSQFMLLAYPDTSVWIRSDRGPVWKFSKWFGIRCAFLFYKLGFSANAFNAIGLLLSLFGFFLVVQLESSPILAAIGTFLIYSHVFSDFVDGAIARGRNELTSMGAILDDIGPELDRVLILTMYGVLSSNSYLLLLSIFSAYILTFFVKRTWDAMPDNGMLSFIKKFYRHSLYPISVRVMVGILPLLWFLPLIIDIDLKVICYFVIGLYSVLAVVWMITCLPNYKEISQ